MRSARRFASRALAACGLILGCASLSAWTLGGFAFALGPLRVSATDPARLLMEGSLALLAWAVLTLERNTPRAALTVTCVLVGYYLALIAESSPRMYGDGHEYIAMARQLSELAPPSVSPGDIDRITREMAALPGYGEVSLRASNLVASDGRQDFMHFWLYSLAVAPVLALVRAAGMHWNHAFTIVNVLVLAAFAWCAAVRLRLIYAILLACGPIIWWIDKAHVEVFNYALVGMAVVLLESAPRVSLLLLGLVTAQNPAFGLLLVPVAAALLFRATAETRRPIAIVAAAALLVACVHPAYYMWHLGVASPLTGGVAQSWPGLTAILTPLVDPDLGLLWWFPGLVCALALTLTVPDTGPRDRVLLAAVFLGAAALLALVATSTNVNSGCTPGLSRYAVWITPSVVVLFQHAGEGHAWRRGLTSAVVLGSVMQIAWTSHPKLRDNSAAPTTASIWISDHLPGAYDPLPEVFAERYGGVDGSVSLPVASRQCAKVLLVGNGSATRWPIPCRPAAIPEACRSSRALCYANRIGYDYVFDPAPRQPSFGFVAGGEPDLLWSGPEDFDWLSLRIGWLRMSSVLPLGGTSPIRATHYVARLVAFQNPQDFVAFITMPTPWEDQPRLRLSPLGDGTEWWWVDLDRKTAHPQGTLRGDGWVDVPSPGTRLLIVRRKTEAR